MFVFSDDIYKLTLVDYTFEDAELFVLLKRYCLLQAYREFQYVVETRVDKKREYIFKQRDENGCILLHYAAQGGSTVILDIIIKKHHLIFFKILVYVARMHCILQ